MNSTSSVLVVTSIDDPTADMVIAELHDRGVPVVRFDSGDFPTTLAVTAKTTGDGLGVLITSVVDTRGA